MTTTWYSTPNLVAEHRAHLEDVARQHRAIRTLRRRFRRSAG